MHIQQPTGIHEIQHLEICLDFSLIHGNDPLRGAQTLISTCQRVAVLVDRFASCSDLGRLSHGAAHKQRCHADLVSMPENVSVDLKLSLQLGVFRLGGVSSTSSPHVYLSFCEKHLAVPAPVDLWALIWCQNDACMHIYMSVYRFFL